MENKSRLFPDITISIISADNLGQLIPCLRSIFDTTDKTSLEVIVTDNASAESFESRIKADFPQVIVLRNETRKGFSTNNNIALQQGQGRFLMLLNDDTILQPQAIDILVGFLDSTPGAGAVGASLLYSDGSLQAGHTRFPRPILEAIWPAANWSHFFTDHLKKPFKVDTISGAAFLVRKEIVEQVGYLDPLFDPIYSEEIDWCYRIHKAGWKIYSHPEAKVIHLYSQTMNRDLPKKYAMLLEHKYLYFCKHFGKGSGRKFKWTLQLVTGLKFLLWLVIGTIAPSHKPYLAKRDLHRNLLERIGDFSWD